ncbi:hypothetical protein C5167_010008 [Papaver somniferum]|uniref:Neprosin PEP catalytic domain-containing protein n=1 Tax=Papaver somniferum TaxID=3469 RepID=A0A4Y7JZ12_PAPSO|nr:uncharacterized protein LOC113285954 [Papaver somniferum]RZC66323.1 hypothetical protein C5167_010008 [Papaver somniferum]
MSKFIASFGWSLILATFIFVLSITKELVDGRTISNIASKSIIKSINVDKDEIIDCYDIYKQPSLNHPLLHNHTIQVKPSMSPTNIKSDNFGTLQLTQIWHKYGTCPEGTIPIQRNIKDVRSILSRKHRRRKFSHYKMPNTSHSNGIRDGHEYAVIRVFGNFLGAQAKINLWNPVVEAPLEISISQIWITAGEYGDRNSIEAGWEVSEAIYGDNQTRFFILWTTDDYNTGCYNLECEGFVHTSSDIAIGCNFTELSTFKGDQKDATFSIHKDQNSGNWWVQVQGIPVGYYPSSLFTQLSKTSTEVDFGGEIFNQRSKKRHTTTQMGSGHFPSEGNLGISSYFNYVQVVDEKYEARDPKDVMPVVSNPHCYDLKIDDNHKNGYGFFYGGPGYNDNCQ